MSVATGSGSPGARWERIQVLECLVVVVNPALGLSRVHEGERERADAELGGEVDGVAV